MQRDDGRELSSVVGQLCQSNDGHLRECWRRADLSPGSSHPVLAHLASPSSSCDALFLDLGLDSVSVSSWGGALTGTRQVGEACSSPVGTKGGVSDCKEGSLCLRIDYRPESLRALVALGGECDVGPDPARMCFDRRPPDSDDEFESAFDALICIPSGAAPRSGHAGPVSMTDCPVYRTKPARAAAACRPG